MKIDARRTLPRLLSVNITATLSKILADLADLAGKGIPENSHDDAECRIESWKSVAVVLEAV